MENDDVKLIQRVLAGDDDAFSLLVRRYQKQVHALAWRKIGDFHIAEEITQDTFLQAYKRLTTLKEPQRFVGWLYVIAANRCSSWLRKKRLRTQPLEHLEQTDKEQLENSAYSEFVVEENERISREAQRDVVKKLLAKLAESERTVMTLHYFGEMSCTEIGSFLGVSANTVKSRLRRAQQRLQKEETMIREALDNFKISPNLTENIMQEISRTKPAAPSGSKPLVPWAVAASTLAVVLLMLGFGNSKYLQMFQKPYSFDATDEMTVEIVDAPIVADLETVPDVRLQIKNTNVLTNTDNPNEQQSNNITTLSEDTQTEETVKDYTQWKLPIGAKARLGKGAINEITYSPDGTKLAVASTIGIWVYNTQTGAELDLYTGHTSEVVSVVFSPDGKTIASAGDAIRLWDVDTGQHIRTLSEHRHWPKSVSFSPDGKTIASAGDAIRLWDVGTGQHLRILSEHRHFPKSVVFSPDGRIIASGGADDTICLWDVETGEHLRTLSGHTKDVLCVAFSPDGRIIASGSDDNDIRLWNAHDGTLRHTLKEYSGDVVSVSFSPDGHIIAGASWNLWDIRLWHVHTGTHLRKLLGHTGPIYSVAFSPDGKTIASASSDNTIRLQHAHTGEHIRTLSGHTPGARNVAFSPDGNIIASPSGAGKTRLWDAHTGEHLRTLSGGAGGLGYGHGGGITSVAFSPDGKTIASASGVADGINKFDTIRLWNTQDGAHLRTLSGDKPMVKNRASVYSVAFSPNGHLIASGTEDETIHLWNVETGQQLRTLSGHEGSVWSVVFSPNGHLIASGSRDGTIRLWNVKTHEHIRTLTEHTDEVNSVAFSPNGNIIASGSRDRTIRLWHTHTGTHLLTLSGHTKEVFGVAFSPDGKTIASGSTDNTVRLWNVETGEHLRTLSGHTKSVYSVSFSPDGKTIASSSRDGTVLLWEFRK